MQDFMPVRHEVATHSTCTAAAECIAMCGCVQIGCEYH